MSMTYYAVTDDPNELAHYGILGMKWGVRKENPRHSGSRRPRSAAYKKAQSKLGRMMRSGIKKAEAHWKAYNSPENKQFRAYKKYEKQTEKAIELARRGKLKYGKLSDEQVQRVTERLNLERQARMLGNTEPKYRTRLAKSIGEGFATGVGQGIGYIVSEKISRGSKLKTDRLRAEQADELESRKEQRRLRNARREAEAKDRRELRQKKKLDRYEHERDNQYAQERARDAYDYGLPLTQDGRIDYSNPERLNDYYTRRYLTDSRETRSESYRRQSRIAENNARNEAREQERNRRASERRGNRAARSVRNATASSIRNRTSNDADYWNLYFENVGRSAQNYMNNSNNAGSRTNRTISERDARREERRNRRRGRS